MFVCDNTIRTEPRVGAETTDAQHRRFRWLTGQQGTIRLYSHRWAVIALSLDLLESVDTGNITLADNQQNVLTLTMQPQHPQQHIIWLLVQPGLTTFHLHTDIVPVQESNRTMTLALAQPQVVQYVEVQ